MLVYGAGGHAKVIISCILESGGIPYGIFDDDFGKKEILHFPITGIYNPRIYPDKNLIIAIGENTSRRRLSTIIQHAFGKIIHATALVDNSVTIGEGTCVLHKVIIQADSVIGKHVIINTSASIDHDCIVADFAHISPGVVLAGGVSVGENTLIGVGSIVTPGLKIGRNCFVAAGSVVTQNIPDGAIVRGNPARIISRRL